MHGAESLLGGAPARPHDTVIRLLQTHTTAATPIPTSTLYTQACAICSGTTAAAMAARPVYTTKLYEKKCVTLITIQQPTRPPTNTTHPLTKQKSNQQYSNTYIRTRIQQQQEDLGRYVYTLRRQCWKSYFCAR